MKVHVTKTQARQALARTARHAMVAIVGAAGLCAPALAQIAKVNTVMTNVQTILVGVSITVLTIAILWVGYKMAFQHAKWSEVSNIVIGGILIGGAPGIAAWLVN